MDGRSSSAGGDRVRIELFHASRFGNGARVAEELRRLLVSQGHQVGVHHIDSARPKELPPADLYIFGSPTRSGGPIGSMRRFTKKAALPPGTRYAIFATHADEVPDRKTGRMPTDAELDLRRRTIPDLDEVLRGKGLVKVADKVFSVSPDTMRGPLKDGWQERAGEFASTILGSP